MFSIKISAQVLDLAGQFVYLQEQFPLGYLPLGLLLPERDVVLQNGVVFLTEHIDGLLHLREKVVSTPAARYEPCDDRTEKPAWQGEGQYLEPDAFHR